MPDSSLSPHSLPESVAGNVSKLPKIHQAQANPRVCGYLECQRRETVPQHRLPEPDAQRLASGRPQDGGSPRVSGYGRAHDPLWKYPLTVFVFIIGVFPPP